MTRPHPPTAAEIAEFWSDPTQPLPHRYTLHDVLDEIETRANQFRATRDAETSSLIKDRYSAVIDALDALYEDLADGLYGWGTTNDCT